MWNQYAQDVFVSDANGGRVSMCIRRQNKKKKIDSFKNERVDDAENILRDHYARNKLYKSWPTTIKDCIQFRSGKNKIDVYYTPNAFFGKRKTENLKTLRSLFVDIDNHSTKNNTKQIEAAAEMIVDGILSYCEHIMIPRPYAIFTGRGIQLIWPIVGTDKNDLGKWTSCQKRILEICDDIVKGIPEAVNWGADSAAIDAARVLRVAGTYNSKARRWTRIMRVWDGDRLGIDYYTDKLEAPETSIAEVNSKSSHEEQCKNVTYTADKYSTKLLAEATLFALREFKATRKNILNGIRNKYATIVSGFAGNAFPSEEEATREAFLICNAIQNPLPVKELKNTIAVSVSKKYNFKTDTISEWLNMSGKEEAAFVKARTQYLRKCRGKKYYAGKKSNLTRDLLTKKRKEEKERIRACWPKWVKAGMTNAEIAIKSGCSLSTVSHLINKVLKIYGEKLTKKEIREKIKEFKQQATENCQTFFGGSVCRTANNNHNVATVTATTESLFPNQFPGNCFKTKKEDFISFKTSRQKVCV